VGNAHPTAFLPVAFSLPGVGAQVKGWRNGTAETGGLLGEERP
jgi:hypothetical protein